MGKLEEINRCDAVIIFTGNGRLVATLRPELKQAELDGVELIMPSSSKECRTQLESFESPLLILDWDLGPQKCLLVLQAIRRLHRTESVPVFMITTDITDKVLAAATEFCVSKINTGSLNSMTARVLLREIVSDFKEIDPVRKLLNEAERLRRKHDIAGAQYILLPLIKSAPNNQRVAAALAESYIAQGDWNQAAALLGPFQKLSPTPTRLTYLYGRCLMKAGYTDAAAQAFSKCQAINPFHADRLCDLGNALLRLGKPKQALKEFKEAQKLETGHKGAINGQGTVQLMQGQINEALALLNPINDGYELAAIFNMAAILTIKMGNHEKGLALYDAAIATLKSQEEIVAKVFFNKGLGYVRAKDTKNARECFERAVKLDPEMTKAKKNLHKLNLSDHDARQTKTETQISDVKSKYLPDYWPEFSDDELDTLNAFDD